MHPHQKHPCPCCGHPTLDEQPPGTYAICLECGWEDDNVQAEDPNLKGGANCQSLLEARRSYQCLHASSCFPNLAHLMGAYFHQDWDLDADREMGTVRLFLTLEPPEMGSGLLDEIRTLNADEWQEKELADLFCTLDGCCIRTTDWRDWLAYISNVVDNHMTR